MIDDEASVPSIVALILQGPSGPSARGLHHNLNITQIRRELGRLVIVSRHHGRAVWVHIDIQGP
jgi:hypothetical protein